MDPISPDAFFHIGINTSLRRQKRNINMNVKAIALYILITVFISVTGHLGC